MPKTAAILFTLSLFSLSFAFNFQISAQVKSNASATGEVAKDKDKKKDNVTPETKIDKPLSQSLNDEILKEINLFRANPKSYAAYLTDRKSLYNENILTLENGQKIVTFEGIAAVDDAIKEISISNSLKPFILSAELSKAAKDHLADMSKNSFFSHKGSDGNMPDFRIRRYLNISQSEIRENLALDRKNAREIVLGWLIDDGSAKRGNRKSLLSPTLNFIGIATGKTKDEKDLAVATFSSNNLKSAN
ncbi:MAG: CAP domain-containing protein [Pyrinomonadaceae bacterium]|nr:CAP domain-containing protein [Pyrinomonadaceae bacterium]